MEHAINNGLEGTHQPRGSNIAGRPHPTPPERRLSRYAASGAAAAVITFALGVSMALMIKTNFTAQDKAQGANYDINPVAEDIAPPVRRAREDIRRDVIVPPPAPRIATAGKTLPSEPIVPMGGNANVKWDIPRIHLKGPIVAIADSEETPLYRTEPVMPMRAERSGHCIMRFSVTAEGAPFDISAQSCSDSLFARPSVKAVSKWKYKAKVVGGQRVARTGLKTRISFNLTDERGKLIPE